MRRSLLCPPHTVQIYPSMHPDIMSWPFWS
jgi:hypothetical protein